MFLAVISPAPKALQGRKQGRQQKPVALFGKDCCQPEKAALCKIASGYFSLNMGGDGQTTPGILPGHGQATKGCLSGQGNAAAGPDAQGTAAKGKNAKAQSCQGSSSRRKPSNSNTLNGHAAG